MTQRTYHNNRNFQPKVHGDECCDEGQHRFDDTQERKYDPIGQPLCIISSVGVHTLEGHVRGVYKAHQIDQ